MKAAKTFLFFAVAINCAYIIAELVFNVALINVSSSEVDIEQLNAIETLGRTLSSFGFSLVIIKIIHMTSLKGKIKFALYFPVFFLIFPGFYAGQNAFIDYLAEQTSVEQREKYHDAFVFKTAALTKDRHGKDILDFFSGSETVEKKVFLSSLAPLDFYTNTVSAVRDMEDIETLSTTGDAYFLAERLFSEYDTFVNENDDLWDQYDELTEDVLSTRLKLNKEPSRAHKHLTSEEMRERFYKRYKGVVRKIEEGRKFIDVALPGKVANLAKEVGWCSDIKCIKAKVNRYEEDQIDIAKSYFGKYAKHMPTYPFYQVCSFKPQKNTSSSTITHYIVNGEKEVRSQRNSLQYAEHHNNPRLVCHFNIDEMEQRYFYALNKIVKEQYGIYNEDIDSLEQFSNSYEYRTFVEQEVRSMGSIELDDDIKQIIREKGADISTEIDLSDFSLPKDWDYRSSSSAFKDELVGDKIEKLKETYKQEIREELGIEIPLDLGRGDFNGHESLKKIMDERYQEEFGLTVESDNLSDFYKNNKDKLETISNENIENFDFEEGGPDLVKAMIVPPIAMFLSLLFLLLNTFMLVINLMLKIPWLNKLRFYKLTLQIALVFTIGATPYLLTSQGSAHQTVVSELAGRSTIGATVYDATVRAEMVLYRIGTPVNKAVLPVFDDFPAIKNRKTPLSPLCTENSKSGLDEISVEVICS